MKYLKLYEELMKNVSAKEVFESHINWDFIRDVKEISMEYLDLNYTLIINVLYEFKKEDYTEGYRVIYFSRYKHSGFHGVNGHLGPFFETWMRFTLDINREVDDSLFRYEIGLHKKLDDKEVVELNDTGSVSKHDDINSNILDSMKNMYPDLHITIIN